MTLRQRIDEALRSTIHTMPEEVRMQYRDRSWFAEREVHAHHKSRTVQRDARHQEETRERSR